MVYITTDPGDKRVIEAGPNCDTCEAAKSGECEAYQAFRAITILGENALLDSFTPGLRSTGRHVTIAMRNCIGKSAADQFVRKDSMDHFGVASQVYTMLATASRIYEGSGGDGEFPSPSGPTWRVRDLAASRH